MTQRVRRGLILVLTAAACSRDTVPPSTPQACAITRPEAPDYLSRIGCLSDMEAMASAPLDASIPGARSVKVVFDRTDGTLYFQNSARYKIHWDFASAHLSGSGKPIVLPLTRFNETEYYSPGRRFILAAVTYYEGPLVWALEMAPYYTASVEMVTTLFDADGEGGLLRTDAGVSPHLGELRATGGQLASPGADQDHRRSLRRHRVPAAQP